MSKQPYLSVVIPSYNEKQNFNRGVLDQVSQYLSKQPYTWEVILSDDGSKDGTIELLEDFVKSNKKFRLLKNKHSGKGPTVQAGMLEATGEWRLFTDFDQSTPLGEIEKLLSYARRGFDVIIGSREIVGATRDTEPWYRHFMGRGFNWLVQILAIPGILDTQCGFKLFSAQSAEDLFASMVIYGKRSERADAFTGAFDVEILFLALKRHYKIKEVPILWKHYHTNRVSPIKDSLRMLRDILRVRVADSQGKYNELIANR